MLLFKATTLY